MELSWASKEKSYTTNVSILDPEGFGINNRSITTKEWNDHLNKTNVNGGIMSKITYTTNESGDWAVLKFGSFEAQGHSISPHGWMKLLEFLGFEVEMKEVSDAEMEEIC